MLLLCLGRVSILDYAPLVFLVGRGINNQNLARRGAGRSEDMALVCWKVAAVAGAELLALAIDFGHSRTLKQIADLLDAWMSVGLSAVPRLQSAVHYFDVPCAGVLWIDEPPVGGATVIRRVVNRHVRGANEVSACHDYPQRG